MDAGSGEKIPVRLTIFNQSFSLRVAGDPDDIERAANAVDELMSKIARTGNLDSVRVAILACLHLQDRVHALEKDLDKLKNQVDDKGRHLTSLLDRLIGSGS